MKIVPRSKKKKRKYRGTNLTKHVQKLYAENNIIKNKQTNKQRKPK